VLDLFLESEIERERVNITAKKKHFINYVTSISRLLKQGRLSSQS
jgi:hypothetical protein